MYIWRSHSSKNFISNKLKVGVVHTLTEIYESKTGHHLRHLNETFSESWMYGLFIEASVPIFVSLFFPLSNPLMGSLALAKLGCRRLRRLFSCLICLICLQKCQTQNLDSRGLCSHGGVSFEKIWEVLCVSHMHADVQTLQTKSFFQNKIEVEWLF